MPVFAADDAYRFGEVEGGLEQPPDDELYGVVLLGVGDDPSLERVGIWVHQRAWVIALGVSLPAALLAAIGLLLVGDSTALFFLPPPIR